MIPKTLALSIALALVATVPAVGAAEADTVTVTLIVDHVDAFEDKTCDLQVPAGSDGIVLLDAAVEAGCIEEYSTTYYDCCGNFVVSIDNVRGVCEFPAYFAACTYWGILENGEPAQTGVDGYTAADGDVYEFEYRAFTIADWF